MYIISNLSWHWSRITAVNLGSELWAVNASDWLQKHWCKTVVSPGKLVGSFSVHTFLLPASLFVIPFKLAIMFGSSYCTAGLTLVIAQKAGPCGSLYWFTAAKCSKCFSKSLVISVHLRWLSFNLLANSCMLWLCSLAVRSNSRSRVDWHESTRWF